MSVQSEIFLRTAVTSEHTAQHGQTLNITHLTVVFKPVEERDKVKDHVKTRTRSSILAGYNALLMVSPIKSLQLTMSPAGVAQWVFGPGSSSIRVRVGTEVKIRGCRGKRPYLETEHGEIKKAVGYRSKPWNN